MRRSRRWLVLPFVALCAVVLSGPVRSQDDPTKKAPAKEGMAVKDDGKALKELKADLTETKAKLVAAEDKLTATEKGMKDVMAAAEAAKAEAMAVKKAMDEAKAAPPPAPPGLDDATKKSIEDAAKAGTDAKAAADTATQRGNTAWMLTASAFVMFMVPGLALFYGGMVRRKNVLATMMQSMAALAVVGVYWIAVGYGLAFGPSQFKIDLFGVEGGGVIGWSSKLFFLQGIEGSDYLPFYTIPVYAHVMFQGMFAIITPALISGAVAERIRFWPFCIFMILWITLVYCPLAHMVWAFDWYYPEPIDAKLGLGATAVGLLGKLGALDFAGGTVVHIAAGMAGLACCLVLRKRDGYPKTVAHPNSMVLTLLGAGLLWFGWFGFNGGSYLDASNVGASAFAATQAAAAAAGLAWMAVEWLHRGKPTALGLASGIVAGLVAVTPASGFVYIWGGLIIGVVAAVVCYGAVYLKGVLGYDDSLDAFGVHGVGGFVGAVLTGFFCYNSINSVVTPGTGGNDGYFAVTKMLPAALKEAEEKLAEAKKAEKPDADAIAKIEADIEVKKKAIGNGAMAQPMIQLKAAGFSVVFAFVMSVALCLLVQAMTLGNFSTSKKDELAGLDQTEHGETGFDFGFATQAAAVTGAAEPRAAKMPKGDGRYTLATEGATQSELMKVWSALCQPTDKPADPDFLAVYPYVTTISNGTFKCRGGNAAATAKRLDALFKKHLPGRAVKVNPA